MNRDSHNPLSLDDVCDMSRFIAAHRETDKPFILGVAMNASDDAPADVDRAQAYSQAGADWWQEGVFPAAGEPRGVARHGSQGTSKRLTSVV